MLFVRPDGGHPSLLGLKSATWRADGTVSATASEDIQALEAGGFVPFQALHTTVAAYGETTFDEGSTHLQLLPAIFGGAL